MADDSTLCPSGLATLTQPAAVRHTQPCTPGSPVLVWRGGVGGQERGVLHLDWGRGGQGGKGSEATELQRPRIWLLCLCVRDSGGMNLAWCEPHRASVLLRLGREESGHCYWDGDVRLRSQSRNSKQ